MRKDNFWVWVANHLDNEMKTSFTVSMALQKQTEKKHNKKKENLVCTASCILLLIVQLVLTNVHVSAVFSYTSVGTFIVKGHWWHKHKHT